MSQLINSASRAGSSLFGAIEATASAIGTTFNAAAGGAQMLNAYVDNARTRQADRIIVGNSNFRQRLILNAAQESTDLQTTIQQKLNADAAYAAMFKSELDRLESLFSETSTDESSN
jgi:hypothetical protein